MTKKIYTVGGTVQSNNGLYIRRKADDELFKLCVEKQYAYILTSRQMGKSSLIAQTAADLAKKDIETVTIDLNVLGKDDQTAEKWYLGIIVHIALRFNMSLADTHEWWKGLSYLSFSQRFMLFFEKVLLPKHPDKQIVVFIDEIDSTLGLVFSNDFLAVIRYMYNVRASNPDFYRLSFVLIGSAAPSDLISDSSRTPFNIGFQVDLTDFTLNEALTLSTGFNLSPKYAEQILKYVFEWTNGHPYLTQNLCFQISEKLSQRDWQKENFKSFVDEIVENLFIFEQGQQLDKNISYVRDRLSKSETTDVLEIYRRIRRGDKVEDNKKNPFITELKLCGVVKPTVSHSLQVRNKVYERIFDLGWVDRLLYDKETYSAIEVTSRDRYDVFISYSHKDREWVGKSLLPTLENEGLKVCVDYRDFVAGKPAIFNIQDSIESSRYTILVLSQKWVKSEWASIESILSRTKDPSGIRRRIIPILLEKSEIPEELQIYSYIDFSHKNQDWKQIFYALDLPNAPVPGLPEVGKQTIQSPETWFLAHPYGAQPNFTGRAAERKMLTDWLSDDSHPLLILRALGGFGKSALAWHWLTHDLDKTSWTKLVWWSFDEGDASFENFVEETLRYLDVRTAEQMNPRTQLDTLLSLLRRSKIILILDGFERVLRAYSSMSAAYQGDEILKEAEEFSRDCVNPYADSFLKSLGAYGGLVQSKVLMTSRLRPRTVEQSGKLLSGCLETELLAMEKEDAVEFFHKMGIRGTHTEVEVACETYGYHPLSLRILAGLIANDRKLPGDIAVAKNLEITQDIIQNKHHVLEVGFNSLSTSQKKLLGHIACFRGSMTYDALKTFYDKGNDNVAFDESLKILESRGLLHWDRNTNKYDLHPIVRRFAYDKLTATDRTRAHERLVNYFGSIPTPEKVKKLEDLAPVIELYHHLVRAGRLYEAFSLYRDRLSIPLYYQFGAYQITIELLLALFLDGDDKPPRLEKVSAQAWTLNSLASAYSLSGQPRRTALLFDQAIKLDETKGDKKNIAIRLGNIASMAQIYIGALGVAERNLHRQIDLCSEIADEAIEAFGHQELGRVLSYRGAWQAAEQELAIGLKLFEKHSEVQSQSVIWSYRALRFLLMTRENESKVEGQRAQGENRKSKIENLKSSIECAQRALELADEQTKDYPVPRDYVRAYWLLGATYRTNNELTLAEENLSKALNLCREINNVESEADILLDLARLRYAKHDFKDAQEKASEALTITDRSGYILQGADVNLFLAQYALEQENDKAKAKGYAEEAKKLATCDGPPYYYKVAYEEAERFLENL